MSAGLLLTPVTVAVISRLRWTVSRAAATFTLAGGCCYLLAAFLPSQTAFVILSVAALSSLTATVPLITQLYQDNYPSGERGGRFSRTTRIRIASAGSFSLAAGAFLTGRVGQYPPILLCFAAAHAFASYCLSRCPSRTVTSEGGYSPFRAVRFIKEDPPFRTVLIAWSLMGFANLMMNPLRIDYLANPEHGPAFSPLAVNLLTGVVPAIVSFVMTVVWGRLFDRINFFVMRAAINTCFIAAILTFFPTRSPLLIVFSAVFYGVAMAGGHIAWSLWVTKIAPPNRVADYMAVHTFLNGIRSAIAPALAFNLIRSIPIRTLSWFAAGLILIANILLVPYFSRTSSSRAATRSGEARPTPRGISADGWLE